MGVDRLGAELSNGVPSAHYSAFPDIKKLGETLEVAP